MIFIIILEWFAAIILLVVLILFFIWMITGYRAQVPFIPVPLNTLSHIYKALGVKEGSTVYDLGCGEGRVLFYLSKIMPKATYIGIENGPFPLILARARAWWHEKTTGTKIQIINQDFFNHNLSGATHIFAYLYPSVMDDLLPKLDRELTPGTRLVSMSFKFTQRQPQQEIDLHRGRYKLARKLYIYEF